jgi:hypothetical protein
MTIYLDKGQPKCNKENSFTWDDEKSHYESRRDLIILNNYIILPTFFFFLFSSWSWCQASVPVFFHVIPSRWLIQFCLYIFILYWLYFQFFPNIFISDTIFKSCAAFNCSSVSRYALLMEAAGLSWCLAVGPAGTNPGVLLSLLVTTEGTKGIGPWRVQRGSICSIQELSCWVFCCHRERAKISLWLCWGVRLDADWKRTLDGGELPDQEEMGEGLCSRKLGALLSLLVNDTGHLEYAAVSSPREDNTWSVPHSG